MHELTITRGPARGSSILLDPHSSCTIGAAADAALRVGGTADEAAVVKALKNGGFGVKALTADVHLNGETVAAARLSEGDVLQVGDSEIRFAEMRRDAGVPERLGGFEIIGKLGQGGMGIVYRARQVSLDREVALKVLSSERTADPKFIGSFQAEARHAARLHHPNVVQVFDVDQEGDSWFFSMELMEGGSVETRLKREGRLPLEDAIAVIQDAAKGLGFAEQMRIIHRDIKPDNLMIDRHGHVKLADLGLAHAGEDDGGKVVGTPHFMSPEQILRQPMDHRSDLYSLGCTFFRIITGETPFRGQTAKEIVRGHVKEEAPRADQVASDVPARVADVIERLLEKVPEDRYQSAEELVEDLEDLLTPEVKRGPWVVLAIVAVLLGGGALAWALTRPEPKDPETIIKIQENPDAARQAQKNRELQAETARLAVLAKRELSREQLATELLAVAEQHPGTPAARKADEQAAEIRATLQAERTAAEALQRRVQATIATLRTDYGAAIERGDLRAALGLLDGRPDDADVASSDDLRTASEALRSDLLTRAANDITELKQAFGDAVEAGDATAAAAALDTLEARVDPEAAWPDELLGDGPEALRNWIDSRKSSLTTLVRDLRRRREAVAWAGLRTALRAEDGPLQSILAATPSAAAKSLREIAAGVGDAATGADATLVAFAAACTRSDRYLADYRQRVGADGVPIVGELSRDGETFTELRITEYDGTRGATLSAKAGRRSTELQIQHEEFLQDPLRWFPAPSADATADQLLDHAALLATMACADHLIAAMDYLDGLDVADEESGTTPADRFARADEALRIAAETLADLAPAGEAGNAGDVPEDRAWIAPLRAELDALRAIGQALRALSMRRNLSAAGLTEQLLERYGTTVAVSLLE